VAYTKGDIIRHMPSGDTFIILEVTSGKSGFDQFQLYTLQAEQACNQGTTPTLDWSHSFEQYYCLLGEVEKEEFQTIKP